MIVWVNKGDLKEKKKEFERDFDDVFLRFYRTYGGRVTAIP